MKDAHCTIHCILTEVMLRHLAKLSINQEDFAWHQSTLLHDFFRLRIVHSHLVYVNSGCIMQKSILDSSLAITITFLSVM